MLSSKLLACTAASLVNFGTSHSHSQQTVHEAVTLVLTISSQWVMELCKRSAINEWDQVQTGRLVGVACV